MKSEIERRRHRRAVNTFGRLVFTTVGPLTLGLLFAAYSPPAHADTIIVFGKLFNDSLTTSQILLRLQCNTKSH
jgi:hypothetical protein